MIAAATRNNKERAKGKLLLEQIDHVILVTMEQYKQKKIKERYKDQDEEDRLLRMQLLAVIINRIVCVLFAINSNSRQVTCKVSNPLLERIRRKMIKEVALRKTNILK